MSQKMIDQIQKEMAAKQQAAAPDRPTATEIIKTTQFTQPHAVQRAQPPIQQQPTDVGAGGVRRLSPGRKKEIEEERGTVTINSMPVSKINLLKDMAEDRGQSMWQVVVAGLEALQAQEKKRKS